MNTNPFGSFIELISLDQELRAKTDHMHAIKNESDGLLAQRKELIVRFDQFKQHVHDLKKRVHELELEIKELDAQEKEKRAAFESLGGTKQYLPLKKEIDRLHHTQNEVENQLMAVWNKLEVAQKELQDQQTTYDAKIAEIDAAILKRTDDFSAMQQQAKELQSLRPAKEAMVPEEWLEKYTHMRMRVADPVVQVINGNCNACFYNLPAHEMMRLERRALLQCKGCFRLLYLEKAMNQSQPE